jgi:hypothetical protein
MDELRAVQNDSRSCLLVVLQEDSGREALFIAFRGTNTSKMDILGTLNQANPAKEITEIIGGIMDQVHNAHITHPCCAASG